MDISPALIYFGLGVLIIILSILVTAYVVKNTKDDVDFETRKIRFAAVTFMGILVLVLFTAILAFAGESERGMTIFEKILTSLSPIAGGIVGYLFSAKDKKEGG